MAERLCASWALSFVEYAAVWVLMLPHIQAPYTGVLKTHESQSLSAKLLESKKDRTKKTIYHNPKLCLEIDAALLGF